jgi:predicted peptidase
MTENELVKGFERGVFEAETTIPYRLFKPQAATQSAGEDTGKYPIVLTLHGAAARGDDNERQIRKNAVLYGGDRVQSIEPTYVLAPQCPEGTGWADTRGWKEETPEMAPITPPMATVVALLEDVLDRYPIDPDRQYVTGFSMGGSGTWDAICRFPDRFAAAVPMSGRGPLDRAHVLDDVRVWAFHGAEDPTIPVEATRNMIDAMREEGLDPRYTEFPDAGHTPWPAIKMEELPRWTLGYETGSE